MRRKRNSQTCFDDLKANWTKAQELAQMDRILSEHPTLCDLVAQDLDSPKHSSAGAPGMTAEQTLRCAIVKQHKQYDYRELEDRIDDSYRLNAFCRFREKNVPRFNTLERNIKRISVGTWAAINEVLVRFAVEQKIEQGRKTRTDTFSVETNIHHPTDSRLIEDCVRVCTRLMTASQEWLGPQVGTFNDRTRRVKKRVFKIANTRSWKQQRHAYRDLLKAGEDVMQMAHHMRQRVYDAAVMDLEQIVARQELLQAFDEVLGHFPRVLDQCRRRVLEGEKVPAQEKLLSIFEPHTDIIQKERPGTVFGHKICVTAGASNMILSCQMPRGNPADSTLLLPAHEQTVQVLQKSPRQAATDNGFASTANAEALREKGVADVVFGGKLRNELTQWVRSARVQKALRRFRAGIEGILSAAQRAFGLDRCNWHGWEGFQQYVWSAIVAWNLQVLARHLLHC